jgi:hypothetical protein
MGRGALGILTLLLAIAYTIAFTDTLDSRMVWLMEH